MTIQEIRKLYDVQPFRPFVIHLADGKQVTVVHRDFIASAPSGRSLFVSGPDESFNIVDVLLITRLELRPNGEAQQQAS